MLDPFPSRQRQSLAPVLLVALFLTGCASHVPSMAPVFGQGVGVGLVISGSNGPYHKDPVKASDDLYLQDPGFSESAFAFLGDAFKVGFEGGMTQLPVLVTSVHGKHFGLAAWGGEWSLDSTSPTGLQEGSLPRKAKSYGAAVLQSWTFGDQPPSDSMNGLTFGQQPISSYQVPRFTSYEYFAQNQISYVLPPSEMGWASVVGFKTVHEVGVGMAASASVVGAEATCGRVLEAHQFRWSIGLTLQIQTPVDWTKFQRSGG